jgi:hypothetical protein
MAARVELIRDLDRPNGWLLVVDGVPQSYVDLDNPTHLEFEYIGLMAGVLDVLVPEPEPLDVVHLGGGGCTLARYVAVTRPGSRQVVLEADEEVLSVGRERLGLESLPGVDIRLADARAGLVGLDPGSADVAVVDVFDGPEVPAHLLSADALWDVRRVMRDEGLVVANVADSTPFDFARRTVAAFRVVFEHVALLGYPGVLRGRSFGNLVPVASGVALPIAELRRMAARSVPPARLVCGEALDAFVDDAEAATDVNPAVAPAPPDWTVTTLPSVSAPARPRRR